MEYGAFLSAMTTKTHAAGLLHAQRSHQPDHLAAQELRHQADLEPVDVVAIRSSTRGWHAVYLERDEGKRQVLIKLMTREIVEKAPYIWLPAPYV